MRRIHLITICLFLMTALCACGGNTPAETTASVTAVDSSLRPSTGGPSTGPSTGSGTVSGTALPESAPFTDYAAGLVLDMNSETLKQEVTVKTYVDGDTTHFLVPESVSENGLLKARYLAINTPESTGKIEAYGKTAALFTREKLENAAAILIESDDGKWNPDSNGERMLVWVWYKPAADSDFRNLNLEILQNGLALANSSAQNRYGEACMQALEQARNLKLGLYSGEKDPNFHYGEAHELTLREIRLHPEAYENQKVAFEAVITRQIDGKVYVEEYDPELDLYFGMAVYLGHDLSGEGLAIMSVGNRVRIVGTLQYYEAGESWQVSGLSYRAMRPQDPGNIQKLGEGYAPAYVRTDPQSFVSRKVEVPEEENVFDYAFLTVDSTLSMEGLLVRNVAFTMAGPTFSCFVGLILSCEKEGATLLLMLSRKALEVGSLTDPGEELKGKCLNIKGLVAPPRDIYHPIKILSLNDIEIVDP